MRPALGEKDDSEHRKCGPCHSHRAIRTLAGVVLIAARLLGFIGLWGWLGVIPLGTGLFRFCPAYLPFGWSTCSVKPTTTIATAKA